MVVIGALAVTVIAALLVMWLIGMPWLALGFGGPSVGNWLWMVAGLVLSAGVCYGWWVLVGTHIHLGFN